MPRKRKAGKPAPKKRAKHAPKPARRHLKPKPVHGHAFAHHAPRPFARVLVPFREGIPVSFEPFEPPRGFWASLKGDLDRFFSLLNLLLKAGEPPKKLPPVDEIYKE